MEDNYFGNCPVCNGPGVYRNIGREHYFCCDAHRVFWHVGSNLFSSWQNETEEDWALNRKALSEYREVEEYHLTNFEEESVGAREYDCFSF